MSFVFDIAAGSQANAIGKFNQKIANRNSAIATQEAEAEKKLIDFNLSKFNQQFEALQATSRVNTLKSGVELSGTGLRILQSNAEQAELEKDIIAYNGNVAVQKKLEEAQFAKMSGQLARMEGKQQQYGYYAKAGSSLLGMQQAGMFG